MADLTRQYISSLCILAVSVFVGLPVWWKTTEVYRRPLPYREIEKLGATPVLPELTMTIQVSLLTNESREDIPPAIAFLVSSLQDQLVPGSVSARGSRIMTHFVVEPRVLSSKQQEKLVSSYSTHSPEDFAKMTAAIHSMPLGKYSIIFVPTSLLPQCSGATGTFKWKERPVFVSRFRHTFITIENEKDIIDHVQDVYKVIKSIYGDRRMIEKSLKIAVGASQDRVDPDSMRQLRASRGFQLSFTMLNPDPSVQTATWNIQNATADILFPFLQHPGISSLGKFSVSSQELFYTDMKFRPKKDEDCHYVPSTQLPPMISSVESKLASHVSQYHSLNFLVYIPKASESPLYIRNQLDLRHNQTDNFLVPQWGGVTFYNVKNSNQDGNQRRLFIQMRSVMKVFVNQLQLLLGLPNPAQRSQGDDRIYVSQGYLGVTDWLVDQLIIGKMVESVSMATTSLVSLVQLLDKVKNMIISDHIQHEVKLSLHSIQQCYSRTQRGDLEGAYESAKQAMKSAETAFFDPSILELLYFPDDQKFAIYIPLFLPISVPILLSSLAAFKWLMQIVKKKRSPASTTETTEENDSELKKPEDTVSAGGKESITDEIETESAENPTEEKGAVNDKNSSETELKTEELSNNKD